MPYPDNKKLSGQHKVDTYTNGEKRILPESVTDPDYYTTGSYYTVHIHPRETGDPIHAPNLASYQVCSMQK